MRHCTSPLNAALAATPSATLSRPDIRPNRVVCGAWGWYRSVVCRCSFEWRAWCVSVRFTFPSFSGWRSSRGRLEKLEILEKLYFKIGFLNLEIAWVAVLVGGTGPWSAAAASSGAHGACRSSSRSPPSAGWRSSRGRRCSSSCVAYPHDPFP